MFKLLFGLLFLGLQMPHNLFVPIQLHLVNCVHLSIFKTLLPLCINLKFWVRALQRHQTLKLQLRRKTAHFLHFELKPVFRYGTAFLGQALSVNLILGLADGVAFDLQL